MGFGSCDPEMRTNYIYVIIYHRLLRLLFLSLSCLLFSELLLWPIQLPWLVTSVNAAEDFGQELGWGGSSSEQAPWDCRLGPASPPLTAEM